MMRGDRKTWHAAPRVFAAAVAIVIGVGGAAGLIGCSGDAPAARYLGYVEAESVLVGPKAGGRVARVAVAQGNVVPAGAALFALDVETEQARVAEAKAQLAQAEAKLADLEASQQRPAQIDALLASRREAEVDLELARSELARQQGLFERGIAAQAALDTAQAVFEGSRAALERIEEEIEAARLAARDAQIEAARAGVVAARANLRQAQIALEDRTVRAPAAGRVTEVFFRPGEVVMAGQPVVEILPPANVRVRFYVPEPALAGLEYGELVAVACDGCSDDLLAAITYIAPVAEFTPPVIFTREERAKLVFLIEATPLAPATALKPGLPVEVAPTGKAERQ